MSEIVNLLVLHVQFGSVKAAPSYACNLLSREACEPHGRFCNQVESYVVVKVANL